jgi:toxin ParE1/3/4
MNKKYTFKVLPIFEEDLKGIVDYISRRLHNPQATNNLIDDVEEAILTRLSNPDTFEKFVSIKKQKYNYYRIRIRNFTIFYVLIGDIMEVRRILYNKRNFTKVL